MDEEEKHIKHPIYETLFQEEKGPLLGGLNQAPTSIKSRQLAAITLAPLFRHLKQNKIWLMHATGAVIMCVFVFARVS